MTGETERSSFARRLAAARARAGMSQRQLGEALAQFDGDRVTGSAVGEWERGESTPTRRNALALDRLLGEPLSEALGYAGEGTPGLEERITNLEQQMAEVLSILRSLPGSGPGAPSARR